MQTLKWPGRDLIESVPVEDGQVPDDRSAATQSQQAAGKGRHGHSIQKSRVQEVTFQGVATGGRK